MFAIVVYCSAQTSYLDSSLGKRVRRGAQVLKPALLGLGVPLVGVVVAAEDHALGLRVGVLNHGVHGLGEVAAARAEL